MVSPTVTPCADAEKKEPRILNVKNTQIEYDSFPSLTNLLPVHADAVRWITHHVQPAALDKVFLFYPNPEPGNPSKRWLRAPFFERLLECMKAGATLTLATNIEAYFAEALAYGTEYWKLEVLEQRAFKANELPEGPRTHFEKKYLARGETCFDVTFCKR